MAFQTGIDIVKGIEALADGAFKAGGSAGQALFRYQIVLPQRVLQQPGPALLFREADSAVGAVARVCTVAVGIGIPKAEDIFFLGYECSFPRRARTLNGKTDAPGQLSK